MNLKKKIVNCELTVGSWITLGHPSIAEIMTRAGFDWLTVDMEHSVITLDQAQALIQVIELSGCTPLVRVGDNDPNLIKRVMDAGAHGVIVPMVNSREDAERAVSAVKYPPKGTRGVGLARAQGYGLGFEDYKNRVNNDSIVIVQIEHIKAVENLDGILGVDGVDGFMVGPYDLSGSVGRPGEFEHPEVRSALRRIMEISGKTNKAAGYHVVPPDTGMLRKKVEEGYRILAFSLDTMFLGQTCKELMQAVRGIKDQGAQEAKCKKDALSA